MLATIEVDCMRVRGNIHSAILTPREKELLYHLSQGLSTCEIATLLFISESTIETHRKNVIRKLNAKNTTQAVAYALRMKWIK